MVRSGSVILVRTNTLIGKLIRFFQNLWGVDCIYNHTAIIAKDNGIYYVYESLKNGFVRTPYTMWDTKDKEFVILQPTFDYNKDKVDEMCIKLIDTKYDYVGTLWVQLIQQISDERLNIGTNNKIKAQKRLYCSEAIAFIFNRATKGIMYINWSLTDPQDIFEDWINNKLYEKL